ncbi:MAG: excisionase family DNA-binding protein, partial [Chloroflexi bacterium]|nr:excisionase family DNA-binding protein [Chloroflexota bacterium]
MTEVEQRPYLTLHEAAQRLQVSVDDCYRMVRTGELPYVRVGRSIRIPFYGVEGLLSVTRGPVAPSINVQAHDRAADQDAPHPIMDDPPEPAFVQVQEAGISAPVAARSAEPARINPPASPSAHAPVVKQTRPGVLRERLLPRLKAAYRRVNKTRLNVPFRAQESAVIAVSASNLRAIVVRNGAVRYWATVGLKEGVVRDGQITDAPAFMTALAALEAKLAGPRLVGRPLGIVVSGRNLVIGRFQAEIPRTDSDR